MNQANSGYSIKDSYIDGDLEFFVPRSLAVSREYSIIDTYPLASLGVCNREKVPLAIASYRQMDDHLWVTNFSCRQIRTEFGIKLVEGLRFAAASRGISVILLEAKFDEAQERLYESCGFVKKAVFFDSQDDGKVEKAALWSLRPRACVTRTGKVVEFKTDGSS